MDGQLKAGTFLTSESSNKYKVNTLLGAGGQGEVYDVECGGKHYALKWYFKHMATKSQKEILDNLITRGAPDDSFLWPQDLIFKGYGESFGYIMPLRPKNFKSIVDMMKRRAEPSFRTLCKAAYSMEYSVSFADNSMAAGWPIIQIDGTKADNVELSRTENGMIISGDLTNAKVTGTDGITDVCGKMPRGYGEVLVNGSVKTEKLYIYADKDGDSEFETLVAVYTGDHGNTSGTGDRTQTGTLPANSIRFTDVSKTDYFYDAVLWAVENGITTGTSRTRFSPYATCTRAQAVTFLWRSSGSPAPKNSRMPFTDVSPSAYYYDAVLWALEEGITTGTSSTTFSPDATCSRAQIVAFLWRSEKSLAVGTANPFADVKSTAYYADAVLWAVREDITKGTTSTTFSPDADCTRAQIVTFLWRCKK